MMATMKDFSASPRNIRRRAAYVTAQGKRLQEELKRRQLVSPTGEPIALKAVRSNAGIEAQYRKRLTALVDEMHRSILYWLSAEYRAQQPRIAQDSRVLPGIGFWCVMPSIAQDDSPADALRAMMRRMSKQWQKNFDEGADKLAGWFAMKSRNYSDLALKGILRDSGFTVEFQPSQVMNDTVQAIIGENVNLIKSIASQHLTQVETMVMQSVQNGRDIGTLTKGIEKQFGVSKRRAALIARDQNNKATAVITRTRQKALGITQAKWRHSHAGKVPRPSHVKADGHVYDIDKGMYLDGEWVWPGTAINCRCTAQPIIPGFID